MERRIRILYVITIIAILAFLGVQSYWLYTRYEYALTEYENQIYSRIISVLDDYKNERYKNNNERPGQTSQTSYNVDMLDSVKSDTCTRKVMIQSIRYNAYDLLGLPKSHVLTDEDKTKIADLVSSDIDGVDKAVKTFTVKDAPDDATVWGASRNVELEISNPFTAEGIDTMLTAAGINAGIRLVTADSTIWTTRLERYNSAFRPALKVVHPYSELENKTVEISCRIEVPTIIASMANTFIIAVSVSILLIICMVWQFSTILKQNRLDKMRNDFVLSMIHELKRPLSTLKMCVSGIENERMMADTAIRQELTSSTRDALNNLSAYFSRLRDISFNNVEQIPLNTSQFMLAEVIDEIKANAVIPAQKHVVIENDCPSDTLITADRTHIINIMRNLVENAIKYSGNDIHIDISCRNDANQCIITVSDNGNGISTSDRERVFDRFFRSRAAIDSDQPGMGLGLSYVKLLVEAHGGTITVSGHEGKGSCFTITLPQ